MTKEAFKELIVYYNTLLLKNLKNNDATKERNLKLI